jgi:hypothetical protein
VYNTIPDTREYSKAEGMGQTFYRLAWLRIEGLILSFRKENKTFLEFPVLLGQAANTVFLSSERSTCAPQTDCNSDFSKTESGFQENSARENELKM